MINLGNYLNNKSKIASTLFYFRCSLKINIFFYHKNQQYLKKMEEIGGILYPSLII